MRSYMLGGIFVLLVGYWPCSLAQGLTIPEAVRKMGPEPYIVPGRITELAPLSLETAARDADLIVHATLRKLGTYLSEDQKELYTDHEIVPIAVIASRVSPVTSKPGVAQPFVLREWGGETTIDGVFVRIYHENLPLLPTNTPLLLLLSFNKALNKYEIFGGLAGAFEVDARGNVRHLVTPQVAYYKRFNGIDLGALVREIHQHRR